MKTNRKIIDYYKNNELDLELIIDEYSGYVYKIIENMAIQYLSSEDIEIFELYYYSSMRYNEISKALNISEFSIKSKLFRIRKKLKKELLKGGYSDEI